MNIVGVDPSSKKVAATITFNEQEMQMRTLPFGQDIHEACEQAWEWAFALGAELKERGETWVFIEEPVVGRGGVYSTLRQTKVNGALIAGFMVAKVNVQSVNNQRFKKVVVGNGNAGKPLIKEWCKTHWPNAYTMAAGDQDLIDSAAINRYGLSVLELHDRIQKHKTRRRFVRTRR